MTFGEACAQISSGLAFTELNESEARSKYRELAKAVAPDLHPGEPEATKVLSHLNKLWRAAQINLGLLKADPITIKTRKHSYVLTDSSNADLVLEYQAVADGSQPVVVRFAKAPRDNDLIIRERTALKVMQTGVAENFRSFVPEILDNFKYRDMATKSDREANVLPAESYDMISLESIRRMFHAAGAGVDPKDVAWIWRRLLTALAFAQANGQVHGAVTHECILLNLEQHQLQLIDWCYSVPLREPLKVINRHYREWYPSSVVAEKLPVTSMLDVSFGARCMLSLLEDPPALLHRHFTGMIRAYQIYPPNTKVEEVLSHFDDIIQRLWGNRSFHRFNWGNIKEKEKV
jgi:hypothetical protein